MLSAHLIDLTCRFLDDLRRRLVVILCRVTVMLVSGNFYLPTLKQLALLGSALSVALSSGFWYFYLLEMMVDLSPPSLHPAQPDFPLLLPWPSSYSAARQQQARRYPDIIQKNRNNLTTYDKIYFVQQSSRFLQNINLTKKSQIKLIHPLYIWTGYIITNDKIIKWNGLLYINNKK